MHTLGNTFPENMHIPDLYLAQLQVLVLTEVDYTFASWNDSKFKLSVYLPSLSPRTSFAFQPESRSESQPSIS